MVFWLAIVRRLLGGRNLQRHARVAPAAEAALATETDQAAVPFVDVVHPQATRPTRTLVLPGQTMAFTDTPIYARTNGYLKQLVFRHRRPCAAGGQLLAQIETPGTRPAVAPGAGATGADAGRSDQAEANMELAKITSRPHREPA